MASSKSVLEVQSSCSPASPADDIDDDLSIFAPPTSAYGKPGKRARDSGGMILGTPTLPGTLPGTLEPLGDTLPGTLLDDDGGADGDEADAAGGSLKGAGLAKATHLSGAQKRALKRKSFADPASLSGGGDSEDSDDEHKLENAKEKKGDLCGMRNTELDPVALSHAAKEGPNKKRPALLRWEKPDGRGGCCYYCARVHERRHGAKTRKQLKDYLNEGKGEGAELSNQEMFDAERAEAVEIFVAGLQRLPASFCTMDVGMPTQKVEQKTRKIESKKRRGKYMKMDVFLRMFPDKDPKRAGKVSERADAFGRISQWVKVYNDEDGIEDFSEGTEEEVEMTTAIDDGSLVLAEDQMDEAFKGAASMTLAGSTQGGFSRADLGLQHGLQLQTTQAPSQATPKKRPPEVAQDAAAGSDSDADDGVTPLERSLRKVTASKPKGVAKSGCKDGATPSKSAKTLDKCVQYAEEFINKLSTLRRRLEKCSVDESSKLGDDLRKLLGEAKAVQVPVLVRAQKVDLASALTDGIDVAKSMQNYVKTHAAWHKARTEGRTAKLKQQRLAKNPMTSFAEAASELAAHRVREPLWGLAAKKTMEVDAALAERDHAKALDCITTEKIKDELGVQFEAAQDWLTKLGSDILVATMESQDVAVAQSACNHVIAALRAELYCVDAELKRRMSLLSRFVNPADGTADELKECVEDINKERSKKCAFWMIIMEQPGAKSLQDHLKGSSQTRRKEGDIVAAFNKFTAVFNSLAAKLQSEGTDHAQLLSMFKEHAQLLPAHVRALASESPREAFLTQRADPIKEAIRVVTTLALDLDAKLIFPTWQSIALDSDFWQGKGARDSSSVEITSSRRSSYYCFYGSCLLLPLRLYYQCPYYSLFLSPVLHLLQALLLVRLHLQA